MKMKRGKAPEMYLNRLKTIYREYDNVAFYFSHTGLVAYMSFLEYLRSDDDTGYDALKKEFINEINIWLTE